MCKFREKTFKSIGLGLLLTICSQPIFALQEGWYIGGGYGITYLDPKVPFEIFSVTENQSELAKVIAGYDVNQLGSVEFTLSDLGEAELSNADTVAYSAANIAGLYRVYDSQSSPYSNQIWGVNLYAKLGIGYLKLDSDTSLDSESRVNMLAGAGAEFSMPGGLSLRTEFEFIDTDTAGASVSILKRFYFDKRQPSRITDNNKALPPGEQQTGPRAQNQPSAEPVAPAPVPVAVATKPIVVAPAPVTSVERSTDVDDDGILDKVDKCPDSKAGYPVRANGCAKLNGVLRNLKFAKYSAELTPQAKASLKGLANLLNKYPNALVQMGSHTADTGNAASELALTRDRIRAIGVYLRDQGVSTKRIKYLAFGAKSPYKGRATDRIDIKELH